MRDHIATLLSSFKNNRKINMLLPCLTNPKKLGISLIKK